MEARKFELQIRICDVCCVQVAWSKVRHFQICFLLLLGVTSNWNHCWRRRSTCVLLLTFQSVISKKAQFMFSSVYFHSCFAAEKGRSLLLNLLCQLPTKDISQALPCAQQFSVDTLFSKFQSFVFLFFYVRCKSAKCKLIWIWRQDSHKS